MYVNSVTHNCNRRVTVLLYSGNAGLERRFTAISPVNHAIPYFAPPQKFRRVHICRSKVPTSIKSNSTGLCCSAFQVSTGPREDVPPRQKFLSLLAVLSMALTTLSMHIYARLPIAIRVCSSLTSQWTPDCPLSRPQHRFAAYAEI